MYLPIHEIELVASRPEKHVTPKSPDWLAAEEREDNGGQRGKNTEQHGHIKPKPNR